MKQKRWVLRDADPKLEAALASQLGCSPLHARLLALRLTEPDTAAAHRFLHPSLIDLHSPYLLLGMRPAVERIQRAVANEEKILIYGDYDVDGTTATVLLKTAIERIANPAAPAKVTYHVPHRLREGYGMQNVRLAEAAADGIGLVISVDTGIRAFAAANEAKLLGLDLIVTDHHLPDSSERPEGLPQIPEAIAVINPAQAGCAYPNKNLCGAGVAFKLAHALLLEHATTPEQKRRLDEFILPSFLKLVAIATIADSVSLTGENRSIVWLGLRALANPVQPGLRALMRVSDLDPKRPPTASEVGFRIAPRINAAGRMDVASDVVELFLTRDPERADSLALKLDTLNQERRATEAAALHAIEIQLLALKDEAGEYPAECIVLDHPEWHRGVLGILASRVVDRTGRPALVLTYEDDQAHGSGRSIAGFHLLDAITAADNNGLIFSRFGGHAHAVGFSLLKDRIAQLRVGLQLHCVGRLEPELLIPEILIDTEVDASDLNFDLLRFIEHLAPFGMDNLEPVFLARGLKLAAPPRIIKDIHLCLPLEGGLSAMGWSRTNELSWVERLALLELVRGSTIDCVVRLRENKHAQFGGLELELIDLRPTRPNTFKADESSALTSSAPAD